jgi:hypothetical protein
VCKCGERGGGKERDVGHCVDALLLWPRLTRTAVILPLTDQSARPNWEKQSASFSLILKRTPSLPYKCKYINSYSPRHNCKACIVGLRAIKIENLIEDLGESINVDDVYGIYVWLMASIRRGWS